MIVSIASGKGGTGKTTIAVNLALSLGNVQLLDCDVEEPNCHLFLNPTLDKKEDVTVKVPKIDKEVCDFCGKCAHFCQYNALAVAGESILVFPELCHSCGGCMIVCPHDAITEESRVIGVVESGRKDGIDFSHGKLNIGEARATPIIAAVRAKVDKGFDCIIDAPPGTSCAVIESVKKTDYCVLVTEPTPFGLHDLKLAVGLMETLRIPHGVIINRDGIGDQKVEEYCEDKDIPVLMKIPDEHLIAELYSRGIPFTEELHEYRFMFRDMFKKIKEDMT
ncbi:MAG: ATP-binding protein [Candidatus Altiarchaeota archaeon]